MRKAEFAPVSFWPSQKETGASPQRKGPCGGGRIFSSLRSSAILTPPHHSLVGWFYTRPRACRVGGHCRHSRLLELVRALTAVTAVTWSILIRWCPSSTAPQAAAIPTAQVRRNRTCYHLIVGAGSKPARRLAGIAAWAGRRRGRPLHSNPTPFVSSVGAAELSGPACLRIRLPQTLHDGKAGHRAVHRQGHQHAQQGEHRQDRQHRHHGEAVGEEPEHTV